MLHKKSKPFSPPLRDLPWRGGVYFAGGKLRRLRAKVWLLTKKLCVLGYGPPGRLPVSSGNALRRMSRRRGYCASTHFTNLRRSCSFTWGLGGMGVPQTPTLPCFTLSISLASGFASPLNRMQTGTPVHSQQGEHSVGELHRNLRGLTPLHSRIGPALDEMNPRRGWKTHELIHGEDELAPDRTVDQQPVIGRIDRGKARVMALEVQSIGGDDSVGSWSGAKETEEWSVWVNPGIRRWMTFASDSEGWPYGRAPTGAPSDWLHCGTPLRNIWRRFSVRGSAGLTLSNSVAPRP
jgi:hypothetical protein